ncbi:MAG: LCP family protein [Lactobacillus sp.]|nr:LCP family protein [Lactobacillus sp.]
MKKVKKKTSKRKKRIFLIVGILFVILIGTGVYGGKVYFDIRDTINKTYKKVDRIQGYKHDETVDYKTGQPFSILLLGVDTGDFGRTDQGRSDSIVVATVNPNTKKTTLVSIARDTYTEIINKNKKDKINHAYAYGGIPTAIATVENLLDIPINHYVEINMKGMKDLIDTVGGVDVNNPFSFNYEGTNFSIGRLHLNGADAVKYSRMRYDDPKGDYGRQNRQRQVISGIIDEIKSVNTLTNYSGIFGVLGNNVKTDISWETLQTLAKNYRVSLTKITSDQLLGKGFTGDGITGEAGISYQKIDADELQRVQQELKKQLDENAT